MDGRARFCLDYCLLIFAMIFGPGRGLAQHSDETAQALDREWIEIRRRADEARAKLLGERRELLEALAQRLLAREKLEQSDLFDRLGPHPREA